MLYIVSAGRLQMKSREPAEKRLVRIQFQIKHLMWLVVGSSVLVGVAREAAGLVIAEFWETVARKPGS